MTFDPSQLTLTCISTGGPATTVTWTRDSTTVIQGTETVLNDGVNGMVEGTANVGGSARQATISGLSPSTVYTVQVAAVNGAGTGPYSSGISVRTSGRFGED